MSTLIQQLGDVLRIQPGIAVEFNQSSMLVNVSLSGGRRQSVKVSTYNGRYGQYHFVRLQSRACMASGYQIIHDTLRLNASEEWPGLILDASVTPHAVDVVYSMVAQDMDMDEFFAALSRVASLADRIESRMSQIDTFWQETSQ